MVERFQRPEPNASLADRAYEQIRTMILNLDLLPGQTILIDELAERLGMSRTPVRTAIARLSTSPEGLVATVPRKGIVVSAPTVETMRELYEIMEGLEGEAVKLSAERISPENLQKLEASVVAQEEAVIDNDLAKWTQADRDFHHLLVVSSGNQRLCDLVGLFDGQLHRTRVALIPHRSLTTLVQSTQDHREILDALRVRDMPRLMAAHSTHRARALRELVRLVETYYSGLMLRATAQSMTAAIAEPISNGHE